jgi:hypothetical protein
MKPFRSFWFGGSGGGGRGQGGGKGGNKGSSLIQHGAQRILSLMERIRGCRVDAAALEESRARM